MKKLRAIREQLQEMAEFEANKLFRLARRAQANGCSNKTVEAIRNEARWLHETAQAYPERMISWDFEYKFKYAFKDECSLSIPLVETSKTKMSDLDGLIKKAEKKAVEQNSMQRETVRGGVGRE